MKHLSILSASLLLSLLFAGTVDAQNRDRHADGSSLRSMYKPLSGDLLFVKGQESKMEKAIEASTGHYTHVAIADVDSMGTAWIIEASTAYGVRRIKMQEWMMSNAVFDVYRIASPFDTSGVIARAKSFLGQPYDWSFLPDNGKMYCSELVFESFLDITGILHLFSCQPMNFRDKRGRMPHYWRRHFRKLGIPIPEGVPGTNPTDMSQSEILIKVF